MIKVGRSTHKRSLFPFGNLPFEIQQIIIGFLRDDPHTFAIRLIYKDNDNSVICSEEVERLHGIGHSNRVPLDCIPNGVRWHRIVYCNVPTPMQVVHMKWSRLFRTFFEAHPTKDVYPRLLDATSEILDFKILWRPCVNDSNEYIYTPDEFGSYQEPIGWREARIHYDLSCNVQLISKRFRDSRRVFETNCALVRSAPCVSTGVSMVVEKTA